MADILTWDEFRQRLGIVPTDPSLNSQCTESANTYENCANTVKKSRKMMADILIKNMEMPMGDDDVKLIINSDGSVHRIIGWAISEKMNAKAIPVPEHNDLADKSVIIERMGNAHDELWDKVDEKALSECHVAFLKAVMYAPTVIPSSESAVVLERTT